MKKNDTDIQDIYRSEGSKPEPDPGWKTPELIEQELRRQRIFNIFVGLLTLALTAFLTSAIVKGFLPAPE